MMPIIIYIFNIICNIQLGYVHLITYVHHVAKLHIWCVICMCKMMEINFSHHILNNIIIFLVSGYIKHQSF
jgi:hypothetical protein